MVGSAGAIALLTFSGLTRAAEPGPDAVPLHVTDIQTPDAVEPAAAMTKALRRAVREARGWSLAPGAIAPEALQCSHSTSRPRHWSVAPPARDAEKAKSLIYAGDDKLAAGDLAGALAAYQAGDDIMRVPTTGIGIARVLMSQGRLAEAADFARWVADEPVASGEAPPMADARRDARELAKTAVKRAAWVKVLVDKSPVGPSTPVFVDGVVAPLGEDPSTRLVSPGKHTLSIVALGVSGSTFVTAREGDRLSVPMSLSVGPLARVCETAIGSRLRAEHWVWGTVAKKDKRGSALVGTLYHWMRGKGTSVEVFDIPEASEDGIRKATTDALLRLMGGAPKVAVHVKAGNVAGQVFVDDQPIGALAAGEGTFMVPAGAHKLTVRAPGYEDHVSSIVVRPGSPVDLSIDLRAGSSVNGKLVGGIVSLSVGAVLGAVGFVSMAQVKSAQTAVQPARDAEPPEVDVCAPAAARAYGIEGACSKARTFEVLQVVTFPLAAVAGGVGIFLLATSGNKAPPPAKAAWTLVPSVGPGGGALDFAVRF